MTENSFAVIAKYFGLILASIIIIIFVFARQYSWIIVPITATLAIITILFGYFATVKPLISNKKKKRK